MSKSKRGLYDNTPTYNIQQFFTAIETYFQMKNSDNFLTLAQNRDHGYTLEVRGLSEKFVDTLCTTKQE